MILKRLFLFFITISYFIPNRSSSITTTKPIQRPAFWSGVSLPNKQPYGVNAIMQQSWTTLQASTAPQSHAAPPASSTAHPLLLQYAIPVLQQNSSIPWTRGETDLEANDNTVWDTPGLLWKHVRQQEGLNCGYHALKNISIILSEPPTVNIQLELSQSNSALNQRLTSTLFFIDYIGSWAPMIYQYRKNLIGNELSLVRPYPNNFKGKGDFLQRADVRAYIDSNHGNIKINHLGGNEVEQLIQLEFPSLQKNILVIEYDPIVAITHGQEAALGKKNIRRLLAFKEADDDRIGVLWTEEGFNHWVGYVALKQQGNISIYYLNSIHRKDPQYAELLINILTN